MNISKKIIAVSALALLACGSASADVITFNSFHAQAGLAAPSYTEDGYTFGSNGGLFSLLGTLDSTLGSTTTLTANGGGNFSLSSLDLDSLFKGPKVTFTAVTAAGNTVQQVFTTKSGTKSITFDADFADVKSVSWTQSRFLPVDYGVDNVVVAAAVPEPETYAMLLGGLGLLGCMTRRKKTA